MDSAIWLYLLLLDKMTSISEDGVGMVLGGKPIQFQELQKELGIHPNTYTRWIERLKKYKYIDTKRTPNGIIFSVFKAVKRFTTKGDSPPKVIHHKRDSDSPRQGSDSPSKVNADQTIQDNTVDSTEKFDSNSYIQGMIENKQPHISLIGKFFQSRGMCFPSRETAQREIKRWVKTAQNLVKDYSSDQINGAYVYVSQKWPEEWLLSTVEKYINRTI